jgi:hypothetical protein
MGKRRCEMLLSPLLPFQSPRVPAAIITCQTIEAINGLELEPVDRTTLCSGDAERIMNLGSWRAGWRRLTGRISGGSLSRVRCMTEVRSCGEAAVRIRASSGPVLTRSGYPLAIPGYGFVWSR